jgi:hypothetical protein
MCYIFRILVLSRDMKELTSEISGLYLTTTQMSMMNYIWECLSEQAGHAEEGQLSQVSPEAVYENLFQLLVMFWTDCL